MSFELKINVHHHHNHHHHHYNYQQYSQKKQHEDDGKYLQLKCMQNLNKWYSNNKHRKRKIIISSLATTLTKSTTTTPLSSTQSTSTMSTSFSSYKKSYQLYGNTRSFYILIIVLLKILSVVTSLELKEARSCDIVLYSSTSRNGSIQSPMYPGTYPPKTNCVYDFHGNTRERVQIIFTEFNLPSREKKNELCENSDTLKVFLPWRGDRLENVDTFCGEGVPKPIMSNGPRMRIEFHGEFSGIGHRGFRADYTFLENFGIMTGRQVKDEICSFIYNSSDAISGWFYSPNFPGIYPKNIECNYYFHGGSNDRVLIRFTYFDVEGIPPCDEYSASDYIELSNFMTIDRKFVLHCGQMRDFTVRSDGRFFRITFHSNDRFDGTGFRAFYAFETERATTEIMPIIENIGKIIYCFGKIELTCFIIISSILNYIKSNYINLYL